MKPRPTGVAQLACACTLLPVDEDPSLDPTADRPASWAVQAHDRPGINRTDALDTLRVLSVHRGFDGAGAVGTLTDGTPEPGSAP
ncbi:MAG: hypothetical protein AAF211_28965 [Myxococcota bacterium]